MAGDLFDSSGNDGVFFEGKGGKTRITGGEELKRPNTGVKVTKNHIWLRFAEKGLLSGSREVTLLYETIDSVDITGFPNYKLIIRSGDTSYITSQVSAGDKLKEIKKYAMKRISGEETGQELPSINRGGISSEEVKEYTQDRIPGRHIPEEQTTDNHRKKEQKETGVTDAAKKLDELLDCSLISSEDYETLIDYEERNLTNTYGDSPLEIIWQIYSEVEEKRLKKGVPPNKYYDGEYKPAEMVKNTIETHVNYEETYEKYENWDISELDPERFNYK